MPRRIHKAPDPERERKALELFDSAVQKLIAQLGWQTFFACTQKMPHFEELYRSWQDAVQRYFTHVVPESKRHVDRRLDCWILAAWMHGCLWLFTNDDRMLIMGVWQNKRFYVLDSPDGFRKRCQRLGLIGWAAFPQTYKEAVLHYNPESGLVEITAAWQEIFRPIIRG